jgi:enoyl-CoA hydratase/carnithine racemase
MFALGEALTGEQAAQVGIANAALPAVEVLGAARDAARKLAQRPLGALMATKKLMRDGEMLLQQMHREGTLFAQQLKSPEAAEAFTAFAQKRQPDFSKV